MIIEVILPLPVTANKLTHNNAAKNGGKGGRSKTKRARDWYRDAKHDAMPYVSKHQVYCMQNIQTLAQYYNFQRRVYDLHKLHNDHMELSYSVTYRYWYAEERHKLPRDIFNYEKQLSDFLVDMGFMLDDSFIDDGRVIRGGTDPHDPRVEIEIKVLDNDE